MNDDKLIEKIEEKLNWDKGTVTELEKIPCTLDKNHKMKVLSLKNLKKGQKFVLHCPDCKKKNDITNTFKGTISPTRK